MHRFARRLTPVLLKPGLIKAKKNLLSQMEVSGETPITILKAIAIVVFFGLLHAFGGSAGDAIASDRAFDQISASPLLLNIWLLVAALIYSFALPLAFNEIFLNPDQDLISCSPYSRLKILFTRLIIIGLKLVPTSLVVLTPLVAFTNRLIPLDTSYVAVILILSVYLPSSLALVSSVTLMALLPTRQVIKKISTLAALLLLILPLGMPNISD